MYAIIHPLLFLEQGFSYYRRIIKIMVIQGMDIVDQIMAGDKMESVKWEQ